MTWTDLSNIFCLKTDSLVAGTEEMIIQVDGNSQAGKAEATEEEGDPRVIDLIFTASI